ncbi:hypothetical protein CathTA2_2171 [Caldalkalibacillus thermarum TA2.A1]|uniref:Uncharacterized protein n=1 Tax=Caldalkalibacillus thermarum (strain TA2.A1) TaxID=986075 RepID=F5L8L6_CALTT|nr:hypothetical protein CathTA2_2171 [Caldalkalibacillus thermarum TA2.A1]
MKRGTEKRKDDLCNDNELMFNMGEMGAYHDRGMAVHFNSLVYIIYIIGRNVTKKIEAADKPLSQSSKIILSK